MCICISRLNDNLRWIARWVLWKWLDWYLLGSAGVGGGNAQSSKLFTLYLFCNVIRNNHELENNEIKSNHKSEVKTESEPINKHLT